MVHRADAEAEGGGKVGMTLEDFKEVYKDKTPLEKLQLLIVQTDYIRDNVRSMERDRINGNEKGADYMKSEIRAMEDRIQWLYDQLAPVLKAQEAGRDYVDRGLVIEAVMRLMKHPDRPEMICSTDVIEVVTGLPAAKLMNCVNCDHNMVCETVRIRKVTKANDYTACEHWQMKKV